MTISRKSDVIVRNNRRSFEQGTCKIEDHIWLVGMVSHPWTCRSPLQNREPRNAADLIASGGAPRAPQSSPPCGPHTFVGSEGRPAHS